MQRILTAPTIPITNEISISTWTENNKEMAPDKLKEAVAWAKSLKENHCDFITIFNLTGLQPEIIQSL